MPKLSPPTIDSQMCINLLHSSSVRFSVRFLVSVLFLNVAVLFVNSTAESVSAQENPSFQMIDNALSPQGLSQLLGTSTVVRDNVFSDEVTKMLADRLQNLDAESLSKLGDIAKKFSQNGSKNDLRQTAKQFQELLKDDPEFRSSIESLAQNMRDKGVDLDFDPNALDSMSGLNPEDFRNGMIDSELQQQIEDRIKQFSKSDISMNDLDSLRRELSGVPSRNNPNQNGASPFSFGTSPSTATNDLPPFNRQNRPPVDPSPNDRNGVPFDPNGSTGPTPSRSQGSVNPNGQNSNKPNAGNNPGFGGFSPAPNQQGKSSPLEPGLSNPERSSAGASPSTQGESTQGALPKESAGRKFNRILMKSLSNAVEKKLNGESPAGLMATADGSKSSFDRLLTKLIDKIQTRDDSNAEPSNAGGPVNQSSSRGDRSTLRTKRSRSTWNWFGASSTGGAMPLPEVSMRSVVYFLVMAALGIAVIVFLVKQTALGSILGIETPEKKIQSPPNYSQSFSHRGEIVTSIDRLAIWLFGAKATWWNSKIVNSEFSSNRPELTDEINNVMSVYDSARYAPDDQAVSPKVATDIRSTLIKLADPAFKDQKEIE